MCVRDVRGGAGVHSYLSVCVCVCVCEANMLVLTLGANRRFDGCSQDRKSVV